MNQDKNQDKDQDEKTFDVEGMTCGHCVKRVTQSIQAADQDAKVQVALEAGKVTVRSSLNSEEIAARIQDAGYDVKGDKNHEK